VLKKDYNNNNNNEKAKKNQPIFNAQADSKCIVAYT